MFFPVFFRRLYIGLSALLLVMIGAMALLPRDDIAAHAERRPAFDLVDFFWEKALLMAFLKTGLVICAASFVLK